MEVSNISRQQEVPSPSSPSGGLSKVSQDTFLRLLIAQLEHQDPLSPMDNVQFTAQLAQFNTLEQMEKMNQGLQALLSAQEMTNGVQAAHLIGKEVQAEGNMIHLSQGQARDLSYHLAADSAEVTINIFNESGDLVQTIKKSSQKAGDQVVSWNGKDVQGIPLPDGEYTFVVTANNTAGNPVSVHTSIQGRVEAVGYEANRPYLVVEGNRLDVSAIVSIREK